MTGHCEHCDPHCMDLDEARSAGYWVLHFDPDISQWLGKHCPACTERERIAVLLEREAVDKQEDLYDRAARIARGEA